MKINAYKCDLCGEITSSEECSKGILEVIKAGEITVNIKSVLHEDKYIDVCHACVVKRICDTHQAF